MSEVCFYLKDKNSDGKTPIYLQFKYNGQRLKYYFNQGIEPRFWNPAKQRVKGNKITTEDGQHYLNDLLDNLQAVLKAAYRKEIANGIPSLKVLKARLDDFLFKNKKDDSGKISFFQLADRFISGEIKYKGRDKSRNTTKTYKTVTKHLRNFEKKYRYCICWDTINLDFYYKYTHYLNSVPLAQNTKAKHIQVIKAFMNEANDLGLTSNMQHKHRKFCVSWEETDAVYLSEKELIKLYKHDFTANRKLEQVRDLFVFASFVGLRFSDYSHIKPENIIEVDGDKFVKVHTRKTNETVIVPCNNVVLDIFQRYSHNRNCLPRAISNQKFNEYIKQVCRAAGFSEKGRLQSKPNLQLWECVSSHCARRSFATNLFLDKYPVHEIMKMTGHKTEKSFLMYIKVSKLDAAKRLGDHMKKKWSAMLYKVAS
jgi:integrase